MQHENLDTQLGHLIRQYKPVYRAQYWDNIEAALDKKDNNGKKAAGYRWMVPAVVCLSALLLAIVPFTMMKHDEAAQAVITDQKQALPENNLNSEPRLNTATPAKKEPLAPAPSPGKNKTFTASNSTSGRSTTTPSLPEKLLTSLQAPERIQQSSSSQQTSEKQQSIKGEAMQIIPPVLNTVPNNLPASGPGDERHKIGRKSNPAPALWQGTLFNFWENPAYTGQEGKMDFIYDNTFSSIGHPYLRKNNEFYAADTRILKGMAALGVYYNRNVSAYKMYSKTGITASARLLQLGGGYLSAGAGIAVLTRQYTEAPFDYNLLDRINPAINGLITSKDDSYQKLGAGLQTGLWYDSRKLVAGLSINNINRPLIGERYFGEKQPVEYNFNAGYHLSFASFQLTPWASIDRESVQNTNFGGRLLLSYKNFAMLGAGLEELNAHDNKNRFVIQGGVQLCNKFRVFTSYSQLLNAGKLTSNPAVFHCGIRYRIIN